LGDLYRRLISAVREVDERHAIFLEGGDFTRDLSMFERAPAANVVYSFHIYNWIGDDRDKRLTDWHALAKRHNVPLWNGEFGENKLSMIQSTIAMFDDSKYQVAGYCFWTWKKAPNWTTSLSTFQSPASWQKVMKWLTHPIDDFRPTRDAALAGMRDFLTAVDASRCTVDQRTAVLFAAKGEGDRR
jgi:hypothetical protein